MTTAKHNIKRESAMNRFSLNDTRAFVTGANTGIGQAIAVDLARHGCHVIAVGRSPMDETLAKAAATERLQPHKPRLKRQSSNSDPLIRW